MLFDEQRITLVHSGTNAISCRPHLDSHLYDVEMGHWYQVKEMKTFLEEYHYR